MYRNPNVTSTQVNNLDDEATASLHVHQQCCTFRKIFHFFPPLWIQKTGIVAGYTTVYYIADVEKASKAGTPHLERWFDIRKPSTKLDLYIIYL